MTKIGLLSDTHSYIHDEMLDFFSGCDEIWHAGDIGAMNIVSRLETIAPVRAVYGNIDDTTIRQHYQENLIFETAGKKIFITHIGGYPGKYQPAARKIIEQEKPDLFISGHSHILKVIHDDKYSLLHINPGAAGKVGLHKYATAVTFQIENNNFEKLQVFEKERKELK
ncbi:MAG: metallophosphoesterase family protein [Bacteroidota bacterium]